MSVIHYFAYGSNLHPLRLTQRIPSARLMGTAELPGYQLTFQKRGQDASGKGHILENQNHCVLGAIYQIAAEHKNDLDNIEGAGYETAWFDLQSHHTSYNCFAYMGVPGYLDNSLQPYHWYKSLLILGTRFHGFPAHYTHDIQQTRSMEDPDPHRRKQHEKLVADMLKFQN